MNKGKFINTSILTLSVIGSLILLNLLNLRLFRADLTKSGVYTLSQATTSILENLNDPVTVQAYITKDMPPPWSSTARYVEDMLEEYYAASNGNFRFEVIDPADMETEKDKKKKKDLKKDIFGRLIRQKTSVEQELEQLGIVPFPAGRMDADSKEVKMVYLGLTTSFRNQNESIPKIETDPTGMEHAKNFEYELTSLIYKMSRGKKPKLAFIIGHENPDINPRTNQKLSSISRYMHLLREMFDITTVDLTKQPDLPKDLDAIMIVGPKTPFSEKEKRSIDGFIASGKSAAFFLGPIVPDINTLTANPVNHGLGDLLVSYGVELAPGLVLDVESGGINIEQRRGNFIMRKAVPYPFFLLCTSFQPYHPITRELSGVLLPFAGPLRTVDKKKTKVKTEVVLHSSKKAWIHKKPYNLDPGKQWTSEETGELSERNLIVAISGSIPSYYSGETQENSPEASQSNDTRVLVSSSHAFLLDDFMATKGNQDLALNFADWLIMDTALMEVRSSGLKPNLLDTDLTDTKRDTVKYLNILGLPLAFVLFGVIRWRFRESRRKKLMSFVAQGSKLP